METTFTKQSDTLGQLSITVHEADYKSEVSKKIKQYSRTASVKGFRPGHVPPAIIQKMYGKGVLVDEVINVVNKGLSDHIKENNLQVVGDPKPDENQTFDWEREKDFTFNYTIGMATPFEVNLDKIPTLTKYQIQVDSQRIDEAVADIRRRYGKQTHPEEAEKTDILFGTLRQEASDFEQKTAFPLERMREDAIFKFTGLEKESKVTFDIQTIFPTIKELSLGVGVSEEKAADLAGIFEFEVEDITRTEESEINQELFDKAVGPDKVRNEADFRAEIAKIIGGNYERESDFLLRHDSESALMEQTPIQLPDEFLKSWLFDVNEGKFTKEQIESEYTMFARSLRMDLIRNKVAQQNEIKVEYNDVLNEAKKEVRGYFGSNGMDLGDMEDVVTNVAKNILKEEKGKQVQGYMDKALAEKVYAQVSQKVQTANRELSVQEFNDIARASYGN